MAQMNLAITIPASGKIRFSDAFPARTGRAGNLLSSAPASPFSDDGNIYVQYMILQNQGTHSMYVGDASTTAAAGGGFELAANGTLTANAFINYGTYLSDWWVAGTAGDVLQVLYIK